MSESTERDRRIQALLDVIRLRQPVEQAAAALADFPWWDSDEELVELTRSDAMRLLTAYTDHALSADDCRRWAEALEGRDDVGLQPGAGDALKDLLFELSTPEITESLTPQRAQHWQTVLRAAPAQDDSRP
jgi:hypothetical protein